MDENKRQELVNIGYKLERCCGLCKNFTASRQQSAAFGTCDIHQYQHLKHTGPARQLSVCRYGGCPKFEYDEMMDPYIHGFKEFLK